MGLRLVALFLVVVVGAPSFAAGGARYRCVRMPGKLAMPAVARATGCCAQKAQAERAFARPCCESVHVHGRELVEPPGRGEEALAPPPALAVTFLPILPPAADAPRPVVPAAILGPPPDLDARLSIVLLI